VRSITIIEALRHNGERIQLTNSCLTTGMARTIILHTEITGLCNSSCYLETVMIKEKTHQMKKTIILATTSSYWRCMHK